LQQRLIDVGVGLLTERSVLAVAGDADDLKKRPVWTTYANAFAQTVFARPQRDGQRLVENYNPWRTLTIGFCKIAPAEERSFHRLEIVWAHDIEAGADTFICVPVAPTFCEDLELGKGEAKLREPHQARVLDARL